MVPMPLLQKNLPFLLPFHYPWNDVQRLAKLHFADLDEKNNKHENRHAFAFLRSILLLRWIQSFFESVLPPNDFLQVNLAHLSNFLCRWDIHCSLSLIFLNTNHIHNVLGSIEKFSWVLSTNQNTQGKDMNPICLKKVVRKWVSKVMWPFSKQFSSELLTFGL